MESKKFIQMMKFGEVLIVDDLHSNLVVMSDWILKFGQENQCSFAKVYKCEDIAKAQIVLDMQNIEILILDFFLYGEEGTIPCTEFINANLGILEKRKIKTLIISSLWDLAASKSSYPGIVVSAIQRDQNYFKSALLHITNILKNEYLARQTVSKNPIILPTDPHKTSQIPELVIDLKGRFSLNGTPFGFRLEPKKAAYYLLLLKTPNGIRYGELDQEKHRESFENLYKDILSRIPENPKSRALANINELDLQMQYVSRINAIIRQSIKNTPYLPDPYLIKIDRSERKEKPALQTIQIAREEGGVIW